MTIFEWLDVLLSPRCWTQNYPFSAEWDAELARLLDSGHTFTRTGRYTADIGTVEVWTGNHPYASFTVGRPNFTVRPRRATVLRAGRLVDTDPLTYPPVTERAPVCQCWMCARRETLTMVKPRVEER